MVILVICEVNILKFIVELFNNHGYIVLLIALMLELIAFPLPGEALMTYCGYVIYERKMNLTISILIATLGVCIGITLSYFIGKILGRAFFEKYGHYIHMDKNRLEKVSMWFEKYGNKLLIVAYFIPGVRHVTGYFSGITEVSYKKFAVNAYLGAFIWTTTFISLGKFLAINSGKYHGLSKKYFLIGSLIMVVIIISIYIYKNYKEKIFKFSISK
jgi:membrane protein DedA with SNARE-associated domain